MSNIPKNQRFNPPLGLTNAMMALPIVSVLNMNVLPTVAGGTP
jgi:hypothetical protein